ncbi:MAG TPA: hypothetical protein DDZ96_03605 [Porphyromonadaceae bacterium]|jgi:predicted membrane protein|uniref:LiaF transmembrane domain-containing protein n=1 Tax=Limibacterium fermenti TaxID=3229863 RepID=UPI000E833D26|nr:hypothetical protein [Porphyromonadaceae bacterium]HBX19510.1 hypothetical protein [Porphyromonadaceae bacterium]HBX46567.1 hypothetical protein [Porphyromonadaceae bacterium]HCM20679.1 hypothetical protein [Porphyromonadaceae bacterium]
MMDSNKSVPVNVIRSKSLFLALLLVAIGMIFLSFNFGWLDPSLKRIIFSWPALFILIGLVSFAKRHFTGFLFWFGVGLFFIVPIIAKAYPGLFVGVDENFTRNYWPLILIIIGVASIFKIVFAKKGNTCSHCTKSTHPQGLNGRIERKVVFGGSENIFLDPVFEGGSIEAFFGGIVLDLRKTTLPEGETHLRVDAVFGGVTFYIPDDWVVSAKLDTVLGGFEDKRLSTHYPAVADRMLIIEGDLVFGGCEIR